MNRGFKLTQSRVNQADRRYDSFYGNQNQRKGSYGQQQHPQPFTNQTQNLNMQMLNTVQQQNLLSALLVGQNLTTNQFQNRRAPYTDVNLTGRGGVGNRGANHGTSRGSSRGGSHSVARSGDKRSSSNFHSNKKGKRYADPPFKKNKGLSGTFKKDMSVDDVEIPDDEVVVSEELKSKVEKLRGRSEEIERNAVDEDVEKLKVFSFDGKGYHCHTCDTRFSNGETFDNHLMSKNHVMKVIDARTNKNYQNVRSLLGIDLSSDQWFDECDLAKSILVKQGKEDMKEAKLEELKALKEYNSKPSNFYRFGMELRKSVIKVDDEVIITSLVESTIAVKDFPEPKNFGCEFVQAVTGFYCRLCKSLIPNSSSVLSHVSGKAHRNNYSAHVAKNSSYENMQKTQNEELDVIMKENAGNSIVLVETKNADACRFLPQVNEEFVRIPSLLNPEKKKEVEKKDTGQKADGNDEENGKESKDQEEEGNELPANGGQETKNEDFDNDDAENEKEPEKVDCDVKDEDVDEDVSSE